jgi:hypothetical protein
MFVALVGVFLGPWLQASLGGMDSVPMPPFLLVGQVVLLVLVIGSGLLLLVGGIGTLKRRRIGPRCINAWVIIRIVLLFIGIVFMVLTMTANVDWQLATQDSIRDLMRSNGNTEDQIEKYVPEVDASKMRSTMVTWALVWSGMIATCPIVMGLVLSTKRIRAEWHAWS